MPRKKLPAQPSFKVVAIPESLLKTTKLKTSKFYMDPFVVLWKGSGKSRIPVAIYIGDEWRPIGRPYRSVPSGVAT